MKINVYSEIYVVIQFFLFVNLCNFYNSIAVKSKIYEKFPNEMSCLSEKKGGKKSYIFYFSPLDVLNFANPRLRSLSL